MDFEHSMFGPATDIQLIDEPIIKELSAKYKKTPAQILLRNLLQRGLIVLPKSVTPARIVSNFEVSIWTSLWGIYAVYDLFFINCTVSKNLVYSYSYSL